MAKRIIVDIGHANGTGARSLDNKHEEHAMVSTYIAPKLKTALESQGFEVYVIDFPELSNAADLNKTIAMANSIDRVSLGISLHMDSAEAQSAHGGHVCYYSTNGLAAAKCIAPKLAALLPGRSEHMVKRTNLAVLKRTKAPWVLLECGFITNPNDLDFILHHSTKLANEIAKGVAEWLA